MVFNEAFLERNDFHVLFWQSDADTDITGDYVKLDQHERCTFFVIKGGSEDVDDIAIEISQAKDASGTDVKALDVSRVWVKSGAFASTGAWTATELSTPDDCLAIGSSTSVTSINAAGSVTATRIVADVNTGAVVVAIDVRASSLDNANGFKYATVRIEGDNVNNACLMSAVALFNNAYYGQLVPVNPID